MFKIKFNDEGERSEHVHQSTNLHNSILHIQHKAHAHPTTPEEIPEIELYPDT